MCTWQNRTLFYLTFDTSVRGIVKNEAVIKHCFIKFSSYRWFRSKNLTKKVNTLLKAIHP